MITKQALQPTTETLSPAWVEFEKLCTRMLEFTESIAHRAYEFFEARGRELGHDLEDWFRAEAELCRYIPVEIKDTETQFIIRAAVPGVAAPDLKISVEGRQLILSGNVIATTEEKTESAGDNERCAQQFYRVLTLPTEVDTNQAITTLKDGVLELTLPKMAERPAVNIEVKTTQ